MLAEVVKVDFMMIECYISYFINVIIGASIIERRRSGVRRAAEIGKTDGSARREVKPAWIPVFLLGFRSPLHHTVFQLEPAYCL